MVQHLDLLIAGSQQRALCAVRAALDADIMIGETLADAENPIPLPLISVDVTGISMVVGTITSPLFG